MYILISVPNLDLSILDQQICILECNLQFSPALALSMSLDT